MRHIAAVLAVTVVGVSSPELAHAAATVTIEVVEAASGYDSAPTKTARVKCANGDVVLGTWAMIDGGDGQVMLKGVFPEPTNKAFAIAAEVPSGTDAVWRVRVFATCADVAPANVNWVKVTSAANSESTKSATAPCDSDAVVAGTGGATFSGGGGVILSGFFPDAGLTEVTAQAVESQNYGGMWDVSAYATCVHPSVFDGLTRVVTPLPREAFAWADCPAKALVLGGGASFDVPDPRVLLRSVAPYSTLVPSTVGANAQDKDGTSPKWSLRAYAICAANVQV
jgi:hypothetical protein